MTQTDRPPWWGKLQPAYCVTCGTGCGMVARPPGSKRDAVATLRAEGWEWLPRWGWVCSECGVHVREAAER